MYMLQIEHPVPDFDGWKQAFDSDPVGREKLGVRRYRILRPVVVELSIQPLQQLVVLLLGF